MPVTNSRTGARRTLGEFRDDAYEDDMTPHAGQPVRARGRHGRGGAHPTAAERGRCSPMLEDGETLSEASLFWRDTGVACRCRPDWMHLESASIVHYKTTAVSLAADAMERHAADQGWDLIAAHYGAGIKALTGRDRAPVVRRSAGRQAAPVRRVPAGRFVPRAGERAAHGNAGNVGPLPVGRTAGRGWQPEPSSFRRRHGTKVRIMEGLQAARRRDPMQGLARMEIKGEST